MQKISLRAISQVHFHLMIATLRIPNKILCLGLVLVLTHKSIWTNLLSRHHLVLVLTTQSATIMQMLLTKKFTSVRTPLLIKTSFYQISWTNLKSFAEFHTIVKPHTISGKMWLPPQKHYQMELLLLSTTLVINLPLTKHKLLNTWVSSLVLNTQKVMLFFTPMITSTIFALMS